MFGGVAQSYILYDQIGEPFKENGRYYINVIHPVTKTVKKVRFYTDKAHAALAPNQPSFKPFYTVFGFESETDHIVCISDKYLTLAEIEEHFERKWQYGMFFGGVWYAPKHTSLPNVKNPQYFYPDWQEFRAAGQKYSKELNIIKPEESRWFK